MLTKEQNDLITRTGAGTRGGDLFRRYWTPAALTEELEADRPIPVRILGEDLVLFRDERGAPALFERFCPHRGVDLSYGRLEDGGLRCVYHGWLFAPNGRCLEQPGEPAESTFKDRIAQRAYPCAEVNGIIWTYMGPDEPPPLPQLPFITCAPEQVWVTKRFHECNYLQANDVDPQHLSFLHRFFDEKIVRSESNQFTSRDFAPQMVIEETAFGLRVYASRKSGDDEQYVRITNFVMPSGQAFVGGPIVNPKVERPADGQGFSFHWHVPIDDVSHWKYVFAYRADAPIDSAYHDANFSGEVDENYHGLRNAGNRYRQDRAEMKRATFAGVGASFQDQDRMASETQGPVYDRSREHLGVSDRPIIEMRKLLFEALDDVAAGKEPRGVARDGVSDPYRDLVVSSARIPGGDDVRGFWKRRELVR